MSLDLDLTTHLVWEKLSYIEAMVVVIEYNGFFPDGSIWQANVGEDELWDGSLNMGASLQTIIGISKKKGYEFIGCDITGTNAFFIHERFAQKMEGFDLMQNFEPARPFLINLASHKRI